MKWHVNGRTDDGVMRHPADSGAWKMFDSKHLEFSSDPPNVRLGLAADGFNPFGIMSTGHSTWPVMLVPYNLPPWLCMKRSSMILSLVIPGPTSQDCYRCVLGTVSRRTKGVMGCWSTSVRCIFKRSIPIACSVDVDYK